MELNGASCVLTGGARGLGAALARELVSRGAQVLITDLDGQGLTDIGIELDAPTMHCDVTDREQVENVGRAAIDEWGKLDLWINNAGIWTAYVPSENADWNVAHRLMEVNYFGTAYGMLEAIRHMRERDTGVILNVLSVRALKGKSHGAVYSASKFAAEGFTQAVRDELSEAGSNISLVGTYPYRMKTELFGENKHENYGHFMDPADVARIMLDNVALERPAIHQEIWALDDIRVV